MKTLLALTLLVGLAAGPGPDYGKMLGEAKLTLVQAIDNSLKESGDGVVVKTEIEVENGKTIFSTCVAQKDKLCEVNLSVGEGIVRGDRIFLGVITDISERVARDRRIQDLQSEMLHAGRLTDMGQVSASLAHELNQPLTAILNYTNAGLDIAEERGDAELKSVLGKVAEQASRAGNIIRRLRAFVEKREPNRSEENIARTVDEAIRLSQLNPAERGIKLRVSVEAALPAVLIDRIQIQQVLINLMKNAAEAMESTPSRELHIAIGRTATGLVQVAVADTGPGIADDMVEKLFQPFVTTKARGMGMGLNICRGIIESHGGRLWVEPNEGQGAVFRFTIPIATQGK